MIETLKDCIIDIRTDYGRTVKGIYKYKLDALIADLKDDIRKSTLFPTTQKKIIHMIDMKFDDGLKK